MASATSLSRHDLNVLEKIRDPESDPAASVVVDPALPRDPAITDAGVYERVVRKERQIVAGMQQLEMQLAGLRQPPTTSADAAREYRGYMSALDGLVAEQPRYASARNNRAQALRRLYGDQLLLLLPPSASGDAAAAAAALVPEAGAEERSAAAATALADLSEAVALLTPAAAAAPISPQAGKTLSLAHTQRGAIYHATAKRLAGGERAAVLPLGGREEAGWTRMDFEEAASRDFALGGRYGNEIARALAVGTNPTAKLCGQMVREAMKKEYGPAFSM